MLDRKTPAVNEQVFTVPLSIHRLIFQIGLYLKRTRSLRARIDRLEIGQTSHRYAVVRLREQLRCGAALGKQVFTCLQAWDPVAHFDSISLTSP